MDHATPLDPPTKDTWKHFWLLLPLAVVLAFACNRYIKTVCGTYTAHGMFDHPGITFTSEDVQLTTPGIVEVVDVAQTASGMARVTFRSVADGETEATLGSSDTQDIWYLQVRNGAVIEGRINFDGWESIHISVCIFLAATTALFAHALLQLWRVSWYGYHMVACGGGLLFCGFQLVFYIGMLTMDSLIDFSDFVINLTYMMQWFVTFSSLPMALLGLAVSISNISLIRHEGFRPVNLLGIATSVVWVMAYRLWERWFLWGTRMGLGSQALQFVDSLIAVGITFGECLLASTILCAWLASRHVPAHAVDYLVILGCGIRDDGTPCPLLAGRVDKALTFDQARIAQGDQPATFVPSGGQGPDEVISEAQSMCNYLVDKGVKRSRVVLEDRSTTTRQNMAFSREVIEQHAGTDVSHLRVGFSTTNYHVFRGYVCAHDTGMAVEGMGSRTKAYFWPNAFLREFAGLLVAQWPTILQTFIAIAGIYVFAEFALMYA